MARYAQVIGSTIVAAVLGAVAIKMLLQSPSDGLRTWQLWARSDAIGMIAVTPAVLCLSFGSRSSPLATRAAITASILIGLPACLPLVPFTIHSHTSMWKIVAAAATLFTLLVAIAAIGRPLHAAIGASAVSIEIASSMIFGLGYFGDATAQGRDRPILGNAPGRTATDLPFAAGSIRMQTLWQWLL